MNTLQDKIQESIDFLQKAEKLALKLNPEGGFYVGFSGGKDSQVVLELCKLAGVKHTAYHNVTTNDDATTIRFIHRKYPEARFIVPKESYFRMIEHKGLPTMLRRWCCERYKERIGAGNVVVTGVRAEESKKRAEYAEITKYVRKKSDRKEVDLDKMRDNEFQCVGGRDKFLIYPILRWTSEDVWEFIQEKGLPINPCYEKYKRVGCVFCPFSPARYIRDYIETHPKQYQALLHSLERYLERSDNGSQFESAEDAFEWWLSKQSIKDWQDKKRQVAMKM